jgi:hypothetical protein
VYVAELPPKYNLHTIAKDGCKESNVLETLLGSPLGTLLSASLDDALYRCRARRVSLNTLAQGSASCQGLHFSRVQLRPCGSQACFCQGCSTLSRHS